MYAVLRRVFILGVVVLGVVAGQADAGIEASARCGRAFERSTDRQYHLSLEQVLEDRERGIRTFEASQLRRRHLKVKSGLIFLGDSNKPLSTDSLVQAMRLGGRPWFHTTRWSYVLTTNGEIYLNPPSATVNHGSFADKASAAGELVIFDGELKYIDNKSGHFKAQTQSIQLVLDRLLELGVSSGQINSVMIVAH